VSGYDKYVRNIAVPKIFITNLSVSAVGFLHEAVICHLILQSKPMLTAHRRNVRELLINTVTEACRNVLQFESELTVEGLIGITLDNSEVVLVSINETLKRPRVDIVSSMFANLPGISDPEALSAYVADYFACDGGKDAKLSKRKRHGQPPQDNVCATTDQLDLPSPDIAKQKRRHSGSADVDDGLVSSNCPEAGIFSQNSESGTVREVTEESRHVSRDRPEVLRAVKLADNESIKHANNSDDRTVHCKQDNNMNISGCLSADCFQSHTAAATADISNGADGGGGDLYGTAKPQNNDNPTSHSTTSDACHLVISSVFSVKQEPVSDDECRLQTRELEHSCKPDCVPRNKTEISRAKDQVTTTGRSNPLQVDMYSAVLQSNNCICVLLIFCPVKRRHSC